MADMVSAGSQLSGTTIRPVEVRVAHPAPADTSAHRQVFGAEPKFDKPLDEIVLDAGVLARLLPGVQALDRNDAAGVPADVSEPSWPVEVAARGRCGLWYVCTMELGLHSSYC
jgi:hypothetical protein